MRNNESFIEVNYITKARLQGLSPAVSFKQEPLNADEMS